MDKPLLVRVVKKSAERVGLHLRTGGVVEEEGSQAGEAKLGLS